MSRGRPNKGVAHVDALDGGEFEKDRLRVILATMSGDLSVADACRDLGIGRAQFAVIRTRALQGAVDALTPGQPGRPRRRGEPPEWQALRQSLQAQESRADKLELERNMLLALAGLGPAAKKGDRRGAAARSTVARPKAQQRRRRRPAR